MSLILDRLRANGVSVTLDGAQILLSGPPGGLTEDMVRQAKRHKAELVATLRDEAFVAAMPSGMRQTVQAIKDTFADLGGATVIEFSTDTRRFPAASAVQSQ